MSPRTPTRTHARALAALLPVAALLLAACGSATPAPSAATAPAPLVQAALSPAAPAERFVGVVVPRERVEVAAPVAARLARVAVQLGEEVEAGQLLAELDTRGLDADLAAAEGALRQAEAEARQARVALAEARGEARQVRQLLARGVVSRKEAEAAAFAETRAEAALAQARALVDERAATRDKVRQVREGSALRAPVAGRVVARGFDAGAQLPPGAAVVTIGSGTRDVRFAVPPERARTLRVGDRVEVVAGAARVPATVAAVAADVDTSMHLVVAVATFADDVRDLPAMGTRVDVVPAAP